ncbi:MAG TPA: VOC family protein [Alphaproteobacteria bacterium]|nr:VOC family protein [Alphaproteobacteria bacterium]
MEKNISDILKNPQLFVAKVVDALKSDAIKIEGLHLDHICYRVETYERYNELKKELGTIGYMLGDEEKPINGRPIAVYKLHKPIIYEWRNINCIELPAPAKDNAHKEGFEHAEFVIHGSFGKFMREYDKISFDTKGIHKKINPDIKIQYDGFSVKFHHKSLENVIKYEQGLKNMKF